MPKRLDRTIGLPSVTAISLSAMLGSGIFVLPGLAFEKTGASLWMAYVLAGVCVLPAAMSKGELATAMPRSGGTYLYLFRAFGPAMGTVSGLGLWMAMLLKSSFALVGFGAYLMTLAPGLPIVPTGLALLLVVTLLNVGGIGKLSKAQVVVASTSVVGLVVVMLFGLGDLQSARLTPLLPEGAGGLVGATAFVFVSYAGVTKIAALAEEVKDPDKNLPRGILLTLLLATTLYGLVTLALTAVVPAERLSGNLRPIYSLAEIAGGRWLGIAASLLAIVTMTAMAAAGLLAASRFPFAMARDRLLPTPVAHISERLRSPTVAILLTAALMAVAITTLDVMRIAKLASAFQVAIFAAVNAAVIVLRESRVAWYKPSYRAPFYPALQIFGVVSGATLLFALGWMPVAGALVITAIGLTLYFVYSRKRTRLVGVVSKIGRRADLDPLSTDIDEDGEAAVVVALFGNERSPEMLVDVATALTEDDDDKVVAAHLSETEEGLLDDLDADEDMRVAALRRRIGAMAEASGQDIAFRAIMTRDLVRTVHGFTSRARCRWLVMQWHGRPRRSLTALTPIGWLIDHLPANLAMFKDAGVRYVRKLLVLPAPGPHDALVVRTADHLAAQWNAEVTLARFVEDGRSEIEVAAEMDYLVQLRRLCAAPTHERVLRGRSKATAVVADSAAFDMVVMSAPQLTLRNLLLRSVEDRISLGAPCSVLTLRTPRGETHVAFSRRPTDSHAPKRLVDFVEPELVGARIDVAAKAALFSRLAAAFSEPLGVDARVIEEAFIEREREQSTGVGRGVALPHGSVPSAGRSLVAIYTLEQPMAYQAMDDRPVDVVFATLCPPAERETHLRLLSDIARLTMKTDVLARLRGAGSREEVIEAIEICSRELGASGQATSRGGGAPHQGV